MKTQTDPPDLDSCLKNGCEPLISSDKEIVSCQPRGTTCWTAILLQAESSQFHDETLIKATEKINRILTSIPPDPQGRKVSLIASKFGILLAWVYHENRPEGNYSVTMESDDATVIKALKLKI